MDTLLAPLAGLLATNLSEFKAADLDRAYAVSYTHLTLPTNREV